MLRYASSAGSSPHIPLPSTGLHAPVRQGSRKVPFAGSLQQIIGQPGDLCRMDLLWKEVVEDYDRFGWWEEKEGGSKPRRQCGVLRTNCIDCLDRTNVVQGFFARHQLEAVLRGAGVLRPGGTLPADLPAVRPPPPPPSCVAWAVMGSLQM